MSEELVKLCWNCGGAMIFPMTHKESGHVIQVCAHCAAPRDLSDAEGLRILETMPEAENYVSAWRAAMDTAK